MSWKDSAKPLEADEKYKATPAALPKWRGGGQQPDGPWSDYAKPDGLLPIDEARANYRQSWVDEIYRIRKQAEEMKALPMYQKELERFGGEGGALDYFSSDYFFGTTPLGRKYKEAGLLGEVTK